MFNSTELRAWFGRLAVAVVVSFVGAGPKSCAGGQPFIWPGSCLGRFSPPHLVPRASFFRVWGFKFTISLCHHFTISPFHHFTISPFHHFTISRFHDLTISPFHHFTISPFHHFTISPFHHFTISPFHISPFHHFTISPFHHSTISPFHHFPISPFYHFTISPFHHFTISPFHPPTSRSFFNRSGLLQSIRIFFETSTAKMPALICSFWKLRNAATYSISSL